MNRQVWLAEQLLSSDGQEKQAIFALTIPGVSKAVGRAGAAIGKAIPSAINNAWPAIKSIGMDIGNAAYGTFNNNPTGNRPIGGRPVQGLRDAGGGGTGSGSQSGRQPATTPTGSSGSAANKRPGTATPNTNQQQQPGGAAILNWFTDTQTGWEPMDTAYSYVGMNNMQNWLKVLITLLAGGGAVGLLRKLF